MLVDCQHLLKAAENTAAISSGVFTDSDYPSFYERVKEAHDGVFNVWNLCARLGVMLHSLKLEWSEFDWVETCGKIARLLMKASSVSVTNEAWQQSIIAIAVATSKYRKRDGDYPPDGPGIYRCMRCLWSGHVEEVVQLWKKGRCPECGRASYLQSTEKVTQSTEDLRRKQEKGKGQ